MQETLHEPWTGSEATLGAAFFTWMWNEHKETRGTIFHVPNELERLKGESHSSHMRRISTLKSQGVLPGVWDYHWYWRGKVWWIELKVGKGTLSDEQKKVRDRVGAHLGGVVSFQEFRSLGAIQEWVSQRIAS